MLLIDKPYVSDFLLETLKKEQFPVLESPLLNGNGSAKGIQQYTSSQLVSSYMNGTDKLIYTNSENILQWIYENLAETKLPEQIQTLKNKHKFREIISDLYPQYHYKKFTLNQLLQTKAEALSYPFILKPVIGFFSYGIHIVHSAAEWEQTKDNLQAELKRIQNIYPKDVMNDAEFLTEEIIHGDEYAVDAYFDENGQAVVIDIYKHLFASEKDVSDRAYFTSPEVMQEMLEPVTHLLKNIGEKTGLNNFPLHIELRKSSKHGLIPIEANAMRFAGWCMTDVTYYAWGINPYNYFFKQQKPDWNRLMNQQSGKQFNIYIADLPHNIDFRKIKEVDYASIRNKFSNLLELRETDYHNYPVLAFIFTESVSGDFTENRGILKEDFSKYLRF